MKRSVWCLILCLEATTQAFSGVGKGRRFLTPKANNCANHGGHYYFIRHHPFLQTTNHDDHAGAGRLFSSSSEKSYHLKDKPSRVRSLVVSVGKGFIIPFPALRRVFLYPARQNKKLAIGLSLRECILAVTTYFFLGAVAYHRVVEKWSIIDAMYFAVVSVSTVGYGDLVPTTVASEIFTTFYGLGGIVFLGSVIATLGGTVVQAERDALGAARETSVQRLKNTLDQVSGKLKHLRKKSPDERVDVILHEKENIYSKFRQSLESKPMRWAESVRGILFQTLPSFLVIFAGAFVMRHLNGWHSWTAVQTIYFSLITASTTGFGDIAPTTPSARLFAVFYLPLAAAAAGELFSAAALALVQQRQRKIFEEVLLSPDGNLSTEHLDRMDTTGDGRISREEYVAYMLMEMGRLDQLELEELHNQFIKLDADKSGTLEREDLRLIAMWNRMKV